MPALVPDVIGTVTGPGGGGLGSPSGAPSVGIYFGEAIDTTLENASSTFTSFGPVLTVYAHFQWRSEDGDPHEVLYFTDGDIQVTTEDASGNEERLRQGHINVAGASVGMLIKRSMEPGKYVLPITLNPNSAGNVYVTVWSLTAAIIIGMGASEREVYGPLVPITAGFGYSTLSGTGATSTAPEVSIIVPTKPVFDQTTATITLIWNEDMRQVTDRNISFGTGTTIRDMFPSPYTYRDAWCSTRTYEQGDVVYSGNKLYSAQRDIPSGANLTSGNWTEITAVTFQNAWQENTAYSQDDIVRSSGRLFAAKTGFTSGTAFDANNWHSISSSFHIGISTGEYVTGTFMHNSRIMTFDVDLDPPRMGTCIITVNARSFTDIGGDRGPTTDTSRSFLFNADLPTSTTDITTPSGDFDVIYDSGNQGFNENHVLLGSSGGAFKGVSDLTLVDDGSNTQFYGTLQIQQTDSDGLVQESAAEGVLFKIQNQIRGAGSNANVDSIKKYDYDVTNNEIGILDSPRSITKLGDSIYFFEGSHPIGGRGHLRSSTISGTSVNGDYGIPWRSRLLNPNAFTRQDNITYSRHRRMSSPMVVFGEDLYLNSGYGEVRSIKSTDWESSENPEGLDAEETRIDNWTLLKFGRDLDFRPAVVQTNGRTGYEVIRDLAQLCFCYIGFDGDDFIVRPKYQPRARLQSAMANTGSLGVTNYKNPNMQIPSSGWCRIQDAPSPATTREIFEYNMNNQDAEQITLISRAQFGTTASAHCAETFIEFFHHVIDVNDINYVVKPINLLNARQDLRQLYNIIKISYGDEQFGKEEIVEKAMSVAQNRPRELELSADLNHHDSEWVLWLAEQYVNFYGEVKYVIELQLQPSFYIKTGDFILLIEKEGSLIDKQVFQVLRVNHELKPYITNLQLRSVTPAINPP